MHSSLLLPSTLLDLTFSRISTKLQPQRAARHPSAARMMHQAALALKPDPQNAMLANSHPQAFGRQKRRTVKGGLAVRRTMTPRTGELEQRVKALEVASVAEESVVESPLLSEEELLGLYQDLLEIPPVIAKPAASTEAELAREKTDIQVVEELDRRLGHSATPENESSPTPITDLLRSQQEGPSEVVRDQASNPPQASCLELSQPYQRILARTQALLDQIESTQAKTATQSSVSIGVLSSKECEALTRVCIEVGDGKAAESSLLLMKRLDIPLPEDLVNGIMNMYTIRGQVEQLESFLARILTGPPTPLQRHLHVGAHLNATSSEHVPISALLVLHQYEDQSFPAPIQSYTSTITRLFRVSSVPARAQAWDLFSHMRYAAHPKPDEKLYSLMIRACASPLVPGAYEPERALDLWTEMTVEQEIEPTVGAYNAVILACARSGRKAYVNEAFRLAKQMLDSHRDAFGYSQFYPDGNTFRALLEGAKRIGDLARARWILAEMVRNSSATQSATSLQVNEEVMMHVFHAYASYKPPFKRAEVTLVKDLPSEPVNDSVAPSEASADPSPKPPTEHQSSPSFAAAPPQSRAEVVAEAAFLFTRILEDKGLLGGADHDLDTEETKSDGKLRHVQLTTRLLNSYLSVYYRHAWLGKSRELFDTIFEQYGVERDSRSYVEALERCANSKRGTERQVAREWADSLWSRWESMESSMREASLKTGRLPNARLIERARIAKIRILALCDDLDRALEHVHSFFQLYPPSSLRGAPPKPQWRSTSTALKDSRPLVRLTSSVEIPDDTVPPLLTFDDLEILHHRLVAAGRELEVGKLKYMSKAYEFALRARRDAALHARPEP
ncbi:hypothetical protein HGRIS_006725 [Hohenbuehelia grisea]|uniref:Uncharacterized protein n=1 Tax=Hohenbuehelia grisea TaxID=104357 RepID=A0ABR3JAE5_9AGAR